GIEGMNNTSVKKFTISNNTICNLSYAYGTGIAVWGRSNYMIDTVVCENNTIYTTSGGWSKGICIGPPIGYAEVRGNMVYRIDGTFPDCGIGIRCDSVNSGYLITNTLYSNNRYGIQLTRSHNLTISNNLSDSNNTGGIRLLNASTNNTIVNNTITGNKGWGIFIRGSSYNTIDTNKISYNSSSGIRIHGELGKANSNVIKRNIIYSNTGKGVEVYYGGITDSIPKYNHITINSIYSNSTLGISLVGTTTNEGVVPPVITSIQQVGKGNYQVSGTAGTNYTVELFIAMGGSGKTYLGTSSANASGNWIDTVSATNTDTLIGTATTPNKSTSEFGAGVPVPFAVELVDFSAIGEYNSVKLTWQTESGIDNARWVIVRQNNNSEQWQPIATLFVGTHECMDTNVIAETEYKYMLGCMKTYNDTIWYGPVSATPKAYKFFNFILYESYPNPFKGNVHIKYEIPGRLPTSNKISTSLKIYNLIGREVKTLVSGTQEPGNYRISWDGRDETGKKVLNGIYFYQIEVGEFKATRKLTLLR
ncbi:MAG: right-handed parallel beta-helix repeat-containing protein, partial [Candidatus Stahlbacteria bacterium]|nr:right-handed parallel beta-helix repeat-containing protein [Candidatus Stahlbacteria bacterium]